MCSIVTTPTAGSGTAGGIISVTNNAAAGKNITANNTLTTVGATGGPGGAGGNITLNASGTLAVAALNSTGGAGAAGNDNGGTAGAISLTGTTGITLLAALPAAGLLAVVVVTLADGELGGGPLAAVVAAVALGPVLHAIARGGGRTARRG